MTYSSIEYLWYNDLFVVTLEHISADLTHFNEKLFLFCLKHHFRYRFRF